MTLQDFRDATRHLPASTGVVILCEDGRLCPARTPTHEEYAALETQDPITVDLAQTCFLLTTNQD